jgi:phenylalanyl-tRNA synthetase beta chain
MIAQTFVRIGHEVASVKKITFDDRVVVGKVLSKERHAGADKLSACEVDTGEKLTIVCGAKNVEAGQFVPVALIGAKLPNGLEIKEAELRGVKSYGMICSAKELGLGELNDGILPLDNSIGEPAIGAKLNEYAALADTIFEIELTPNRGDCLSVFGLARELSAALDVQLHGEPSARVSKNPNGIGRILHLTSEPETTASALIYAIENLGLELPLIARLRLAWSDALCDAAIDALTAYASLTTGVLFRAYDLKTIGGDEMKAKLRVVKRDGLNLLIEEKNGKTIERIGIDADLSFAANDNSRIIVFEAFFAPPEEIAKIAYDRKLKGDALFNRVVKGSDPNLAFGARFFCALVSRFSPSRFYAESLGCEPKVEARMISVSASDVSALIGRDIHKNKIVEILKRLGAKVRSNGDQQSFLVAPPIWRHDLLNDADLTEEVARIMGVDQIEPKPLLTRTDRAASEGWKYFRFERGLAHRAAAIGFYESIHFLFCDQSLATAFGFKPIAPNLNVANPIASNLNALRPTLLINLLEAAARNRAKGRSSARLFEIGDIYDENRVHSREIAFVFSGEKESPNIQNRGKVDDIDLFGFARLIAGATFDFSLANAQIAYLQAGQAARIIADGKPIGEIGKLAPHIAKRFDLREATFVARIDLGATQEREPRAKPFSKLQPIERDLSVVIDKNVEFGAVKSAIESIADAALQKILAIDLYDDPSLGDKRSLTLRLVIRAFDKTLSEEEIAKITDRVLDKLKASFGAALR